MTQFAESLRAERDRSVRSCGELGVELDRLRAELSEMETDRDKYQNWYDGACEEVAEAYRARNEED